jgi:outer membrane lipoprotein-sorting protein
MKRLIVLLLTLAASVLHAEDPSAALARVDAYRTPLDSFSMDIELTSIKGSRREVSRLTIYTKGTDRSVVEFTYPTTEKGKALLMLRDAMWIYLPSASKPIRISPLQRLLGQASNGDVARTSFTTDYEATAAIADRLDDRETLKLDLTAKDVSIAYKRIVLWVDAHTYAPIRSDFYVTSGKLVKRAHYREFAEMAGHKTVSRIEIEDLLREGEKTVMAYSNLKARENPERMFSKDSFGR